MDGGFVYLFYDICCCFENVSRDFIGAFSSIEKFIEKMGVSRIAN